MRVLRQRSEHYAVARLDPREGWPWWATYSVVASVTRTPTETSVVVEERLVPSGVRAERGFTVFSVQGPIDFATVGILADLTRALATANVSCFAVSTYDTDLVLVRETDVARAAAAWRDSGWTVSPTE
jgi:hypothetical protein